MLIVNLTRGVPPHLTDDENEKALQYNNFITKEISFDDLYVSGHWTSLIRDCAGYQSNVVNDSAKFAQNFKLISDRITSPKQYTDFVGKLTYYITKYDKDNYLEAIAHTVLNSGKVTEYLGSMQVYLKSMIGMQAPDLILANDIGKTEKNNPKRASYVMGQIQDWQIKFAEFQNSIFQ